MKLLNLITFIFIFGIVNAQEKSPNQIRKEIYSLIIKDLKAKNDNLPLKKIVIDHTISKYKNITFDTFGIKLEEEETSQDSSICKNFDNIACVDPIEINRFTLNKIYQNHNDSDYVDFYGIYSPVDKWYNLIFALAKNSFENEKSKGFNIHIPVRNVYYKNGKQMNQLYVYQFDLDQNFEIISYKNVKI